MQNKSFIYHLIIVFTLLILPLKAELFKITISSTVENEDPTVAKQTMIKENRVVALKQAIAKIIKQEDESSLNTLITIDIAKAAEVQFSIIKEVVQETTYSLTIEYVFDKKYIYNFLSTNNIYHIEKVYTDNKIVVIPIININGLKSIYQPNQWLELWQSIEPNTYLSTFIIPTQNEIKEEDVYTNNKDKLLELKNKFSANQVYLVILNINKITTENDESKEIYDLEIYDVLEARFIKSKPETIPVAFSKTIKELESSYKTDNLEKIEKSKVSKLFTFELSGISEWILVYNKLLKISEVSKVIIKEMTMDYVIAIINYDGEIIEFQKDLRKNKLNLNTNNFIVTQLD